MIRIEHYDGLNRTPALYLALKAHVELLAADLHEPVLNVYWDHRAIVAFDEQEPIGVLTYTHTPGMLQLDIALGWVAPERRGRGVYGLIWKALIGKAQELKAVRIMSTTHMNNATLRQTAQNQGRVERGIILTFDVPPVLA